MSVLRQQASHLLLIRANSGYGIIMAAACARPGCSATRCCYCGRQQTLNLQALFNIHNHFEELGCHLEKPEVINVDL
jgi:hypothetical protein